MRMTKYQWACAMGIILSIGLLHASAKRFAALTSAEKLLVVSDRSMSLSIETEPKIAHELIKNCNTGDKVVNIVRQNAEQQAELSHVYLNTVREWRRESIWYLAFSALLSILFFGFLAKSLPKEPVRLGENFRRLFRR